MRFLCERGLELGNSPARVIELFAQLQDHADSRPVDLEIAPQGPRDEQPIDVHDHEIAVAPLDDAFLETVRDQLLVALDEFDLPLLREVRRHDVCSSRTGLEYAERAARSASASAGSA